ncbi:MAG: tetratricopeptide repeat protein [Bacteroidota bacterium]
MKRKPLFFILIVGVLLWSACSPKTNEPVTATPEPEKEKIVEKKLDPNGCIVFNDLSPGIQDRVTDNYNIYRDRIKEEDFKAAYPRWKDVYENAPKTNGRIDYVFRDGLKIYTAFIEATSDTVLQQKYVDTMMMIYEKAVICFPEKKSYYMSKQGFDMFYKYKGKMSDEEIYQMLKTAVEEDKNDSRVSTIIPLSSLNYRLYSDEKISLEDAKKTLTTVNGVVEYNAKNCKSTKECNAWRQVEQYTVELADRFENRKGFYDCDYFLAKYYAEFEAQPENCDLIEDLYRRLKRGGCEKENPKMVGLVDVYKNKCSAPGPLVECRTLLENEQYQAAIDCYDNYIKNNDPDDNLKATLLLRIAKIHYGHTGKFSTARDYARQALKAKPDWGDPLVLIGKLYASSGPICGPGTGFDSQIVTWVAIDKWNEAKRVDPSVSSEANKLIGQYSKYMPSKEDIFQRPIKEGDSFKVKCWIQETTKVRAAK